MFISVRIVWVLPNGSGGLFVQLIPEIALSLQAGFGTRTCEDPTKSKTDQLAEKIGSGGRDRTYDQLINSQLLYR